MRTRFLGHVLLISGLAAVALPAQSQEPGLDLFQDDNNGRRAQFAQAGPPAAGIPAAASAPSMVLKGIYRFGDTYYVSMENDEGASYKATWRSGQEAAVPVLNGYQLEAVDARTVTLALPAGSNCQATAQNGGSCIGRNRVSLSFAETEPVSPARNFRGNRGGNNNDNVPSFLRDGGNDPRTNATNIRTLFEAANGGDAAAREQLEGLIGNRGRGNGGGGGGRGGRGGGNNGGGGNGGRGQ